MITHETLYQQMSVQCSSEVRVAFSTRRRFLLDAVVNSTQFAKDCKIEWSESNVPFWAERLQECNDAQIELGMVERS